MSPRRQFFWGQQWMSSVKFQKKVIKNERTCGSIAKWERRQVMTLFLIWNDRPNTRQGDNYGQYTIWWGILRDLVSQGWRNSRCKCTRLSRKQRSWALFSRVCEGSTDKGTRGIKQPGDSWIRFRISELDQALCIGGRVVRELSKGRAEMTWMLRVVCITTLYNRWSTRSSSWIRRSLERRRPHTLWVYLVTVMKDIYIINFSQPRSRDLNFDGERI